MFRQSEIPWQFPDSSQHSAALGILSVTHITLSVVGVGMQQCMIWNHKFNKKYVLSNSESVQCNFFIFDHVTFIQFKICCSAAVYKISSKLDDFSLRYGVYQFSEWRPSAILELFYHDTRPPMKSLLLATAACQISSQSDAQIWRYSYLNFSHIWLKMPIEAPKMGILRDFGPQNVIIHCWDPQKAQPCINPRL